MSDMTMTLVYDDEPPVYRRGARTTLEAASLMIKLLGDVEREQTGKAPQIIWDINIYSLNDRAVIELTAVGDKKAGRTLMQDVAPAIVQAVNEQVGES